MSREQKYRLLEDVSEQEIQQLQQLVNSSLWRQQYHIQPHTGLLNDPNGFAYYDGAYHLFYQWFPLGTDHGMKYWYHMKSVDLNHWEDAGIGIIPGDRYDSHGAYSGSGIVHEDQLYLMYTGNTRDDAWIRHPYQCLAVMKKDGTILKRPEPVIADVPTGYTDHFRDPKVWKNGNDFYCVIGAQRTNQTGCIMVYRSADLLQWELLGELKTELPAFGYMWECPDYFEMNGQAVLLFCPQGIDAQGEQYRNIYQSGYVSGAPLQLPELTLRHGAFHELDYGFDFYAPQTTAGPDGRRILVGWMGLPDIGYPTDNQGWAHCLTLPRELELNEHGKLLQRPARELVQRRSTRYAFDEVLPAGRSSYPGFEGTAYELLCTFGAFYQHSAELAEQPMIIELELRTGPKEKTVLRYNANECSLLFDRSASGVPFAEAYGSTRTCRLDRPLHQLQIFMDVSSVEIFVNDGEAVFTSRIFPHADSTGIHFVTHAVQVQMHAEKWDYTAD